VIKGCTYVWLRAVRMFGYVLYPCVTKGYTHVTTGGTYVCLWAVSMCGYGQ